MSETIRTQIRDQIAQRGIYDRLLTTEEAAAATGLSQYELRRGGKEGRYPVILCGAPRSKFRKQKWNLAALEDDEIPAMPEGMLSENSFTRYTYEG